MANRKSNNKKYSNSRNYRKYSSRQDGKDKEVEIDIDRDSINKADLLSKGRNYKSDRNDSSWYAKNPALLQAAGSFPFGYPIGVTLPGVHTAGYLNNTVPGLMVLHFIPTIGRSEDAASPINLAAKMQYSNVRYANSGTTYGDPSDLMMYYLAIDSMYMFHQSLVRAYGVLRTYNYMNRYYPQAVVQAMGFDFDDLNANINQLWGYINTFAVKLQSFAAPGDMSYFIRHAWMASGIYLDSNTSKAQSYMYVPIAYYKWNEVTSGPNNLLLVSPFGVGSKYKAPFADINSGPVQLSGNENLLKLSDLMAFGESLMQPVLASESFGLTTGAILKSYGQDSLMKVGQIAQDYQVMPAYNAEVLSQIENATIFEAVDVGTSLNNFTITQSTDVDEHFIISKPSIQSVVFSSATTASATSGRNQNFIRSTNKMSSYLINMHIEQPTPADFIVATRLTATCTNLVCKSGGSTNNLVVQADLNNFGSEVVINANIITMLGNLASTIIEADSIKAIPYLSLAKRGTSFTVNDSWWTWTDVSAALIQQFDWHPSCHVFNSTDTVSTMNKYVANQPIPEQTYTFNFDTRDIDNFAIVDDGNLELLNQVAMLSLFDSPRIAQLVAKPYKR